MQDWYSNDEAGAAALGEDPALYDNDRGDDEGYAPVTRGTGNPLIDAVNSALIWSIAWTPADIEQTAPGVVAFTVPDYIDAARAVSALARDGFESLVHDGRLFVRHIVAGAA